jgi:hypothetical protein
MNVLPYSQLLLNAMQSGIALWATIDKSPTVVISLFCEVDCYAAGVMAAIPNEALRIMSVKVKTQMIPNAGEAGHVISSYTCNGKGAAQAIIVNAFNQNIAVLRTIIYQACDMNIPLERCFILGPCMSHSFYAAICAEFDHDFNTCGITFSSDATVKKWCLKHPSIKGVPQVIINRLMEVAGPQQNHA